MRVNDLIPIASGAAHLGVDGTGLSAFDFGSLSPWGHLHVNSGVFHHPFSTGWESGVLRFNAADPSFEISLDGGITFNDLLTSASVVTSVGVLGGSDIVGDVDFTSTSGFIVITDNGGASPISWNVDVWGLSGLFGFPSNGFSNIPQCHSQTFSSSTTWTVTHGLNSLDVIVMVFDGSSPAQVIIPDKMETTDANTVTIRHNVATAGRVTVVAC